MTHGYLAVRLRFRLIGDLPDIWTGLFPFYRYVTILPKFVAVFIGALTSLVSVPGRRQAFERHQGYALREQIRAIVGLAGFLEGEDNERKNCKDWMVQSLLSMAMV